MQLHAKHTILIGLEFACIVRWRSRVTQHNSSGSLSAVTDNNFETLSRLRLYADPRKVANIEPEEWNFFSSLIELRRRGPMMFGTFRGLWLYIITYFV